MRNGFYKLDNDGRKVGDKGHKELNARVDELVDASKQTVDDTVDKVRQTGNDADDNTRKLGNQRNKQFDTALDNHRNHTEQGRYTPTVNGKRVARNIYADSEEECEKKLEELIKEMKAEFGIK